MLSSCDLSSTTKHQLPLPTTPELNEKTGQFIVPGKTKDIPVIDDDAEYGV